jgi:hypothetical protein
MVAHIGIAKARSGFARFRARGRRFSGVRLSMSVNRLLVWPLAALVIAACSPVGTKGTMPPGGPNGDIDPRAVPDFIAVVVGNGDELGYVRKEFLLPAPTTYSELPHSDPWPVYAEDLRTLIGHMVQGKGFVPLGVDPATIPNRPVHMGPYLGPPEGAHVVTLYLRNALAATAWVASLVEGAITESAALAGGVGVRCLTSAPGGRLLLMDRPPDDADGQTWLEIGVPVGTDEAVTLWIDIDAQGTITHGQGVPDWWSGVPQGC